MRQWNMILFKSETQFVSHSNLEIQKKLQNTKKQMTVTKFFQTKPTSNTPSGEFKFTAPPYYDYYYYFGWQRCRILFK
jgi:hypothetical protein